MFKRIKTLYSLIFWVVLLLFVSCDFSPNTNLNNSNNANNNDNNDKTGNRILKISDLPDIGGLEPSLSQYLKLESGVDTDKYAIEALRLEAFNLNESVPNIFNEIADSNFINKIDNKSVVNLENYEFDKDYNIYYKINNLNLTYESGGTADVEDFFNDLFGYYEKDAIEKLIEDKYGDDIKLKVQANIEEKYRDKACYNDYSIDIEFSLKKNENGKYDLLGNIYVNQAGLYSIVNMYYGIKYANNFKLENIVSSVTFDELYNLLNGADSLSHSNSITTEDIKEVLDPFDFSDSNDFYTFQIGDDDGLMDSNSYDLADSVYLLSLVSSTDVPFEIPSNTTNQDIEITSSTRGYFSSDSNEYHDYNFSIEEETPISVMILSSEMISTDFFKDGVEFEPKYSSDYAVYSFNYFTKIFSDVLQKGEYTIRVKGEYDYGCFDIFLNEYVEYNKDISLESGTLTLNTMPAHKIAKGTPLFMTWTMSGNDNDKISILFDLENTYYCYCNCSGKNYSSFSSYVFSRLSDTSFLWPVDLDPIGFEDYDSSSLQLEINIDGVEIIKSIEYKIESK